jgi:hypothetical protein
MKSVGENAGVEGVSGERVSCSSKSRGMRLLVSHSDLTGANRPVSRKSSSPPATR